MTMSFDKNNSTYLYKTSCPSCGSKDNNAIYSDGGEHCFGASCSHHVKGDTTGSTTRDASEVSKRDNKYRDFVVGEYKALESRHITEETCRKWGYTIGYAFNKATGNSESCQIANYYHQTTGELEAQKLRFKGKNFSCVGKPNSFFGSHLCKNKSKYLVITEGEIDAMSYSQAVNYKYPVVSIPNGSESAKKIIQKELKWLEEIADHIVLMFDNDKAGEEAVKQCAPLFSPNKCLVASLSEKDANEMLKKGKVAELVNAVFKAKVYKPASIVSGSDTWELVSKITKPHDAEYPYESLNAMLHGLRKGEMVTVCAGSGIGKSQLCREIAFNLINEGEALGYIALEESVRRTALGLMSIEANEPLHLNIEGYAIENLKSVYDKVINNDRVYFYDHFGSLDSDNLINHLRYMVNGFGVQWIILDHISIVVSGIDGGDERRVIDNMMTKLRSLVQELHIGMIIVSHLKRPEGKGHEDGSATSLSHLRGSGSIAQLSDIVIGIERNQQSAKSNVSTLRVLKNRHSGETGIAGYLLYDTTTGRLLEHTEPGSSFNSHDNTKEQEDVY